MTWYCLNPNLFLNFCAALVLQSMITLAANFLSIRFLWDCLFVPLIDHIYVLHSVNHILLFFLANFYYVIFLLYVFIYYCFYVISFISCPPCFNHIYLVYSTEFSGFLFSSFISLYFLNTSLLIYESIKDSEIKL